MQPCGRARRPRPHAGRLPGMLILLCHAFALHARAEVPNKVEVFTASPGPAALTPAEREKVASAAGLAPPAALLSPLPAPRWDASSTVLGPDGQCSYVLITTTQTAQIFANTLFEFNQQAIYWNAFAVRPFGTSDWDLSMYDTTAPAPQCVAGLLASSTANAGIVDFVVGDYNHNPLGLDFPSVYRFSGSEDAYIQWDTGPDRIILDGTIHRPVSALDIIEIWDVFLATPNKYTLYIDDGGTGSAGSRLFLFKNPAAARYYAGRSQAVVQQGSGYTEYVAAADDWYGLAVTNENGGTGEYDLAVRQCLNPAPLAYETSVSLTAPGDEFVVNQPSGVWAGMGVRGNNVSWTAQLYKVGAAGSWPACGGPLVTQDAGTQARLVLGDFRVNPAATYYPTGIKTPSSGFGGARIEWDDGRKTLAVNGSAVSRTPSPNDVLEIWNVNLTAGAHYTFEFATSGAATDGLDADYRLLLFGNPSGSQYWPLRGQSLFDTAQHRTVFTPTFSGAYAVVVVNDNGGTGDYSLAVRSGVVGLAAGESPSFVTELTRVAPNPTSGPARIDFELRQPARVDLAIVDVAGRSVAEIVPRDWPSGRWSESWAGRDRAGRSVPAGVYWVRMTVGGREISGQKLLVVR